ncbi:MAG: hypothetical protein DMD63_16045 [Gemmatimonadetes bacterium]|nr:MAG: hypothetical protein DMD63_16045 [Gemmatimonadota bacterium]
MKSLELFRQWRRRVRVKMQDQIQNASATLNRLIGEARTAVNGLEVTSNERRNTRTQIESFRQFKEPEGVRVGYDRILKSSFSFWAFAVILTIAEFTANFPVFRLLLPMNSTLVTLAATLGEAAESHTWLAGPLVLFQDILLHFEAFLVALIAVVILVFLGNCLLQCSGPSDGRHYHKSASPATHIHFRRWPARDRVGAGVHVLLARTDRRDGAVTRTRRQCRAETGNRGSTGGRH